MLNFKISDNIALRTLQKADAATLYALVDKNRAYLREWLPWLDRNTRVENSAEYICSIQPDARQDGGFICGIFVEGYLVGVCGFHPVNVMNNSVSIGYWLTQERQGQGIITQCTHFFINYAFNDLGLNKVLIPVAVENHKSRAVCKRLGLINEGIDREGEFLYDRYVDLVRYSILRNEWNLINL